MGYDGEVLELYRRWRWPGRRGAPSVRAARRAHEAGQEEERELLHGLGSSRYAGDFVFGGIDGAVTTFAVVAGVAGAQLPPAMVVVLGLANLLADGLTMGIGNFLNLRSGEQRYRQALEREMWEIEHLPDQERAEVRVIYAAKGFSGEVLDTIVATLTADRKRWLATMMSEELGLVPETRRPQTGGLVTFAAFVLIGSIPLLPYVLSMAVPALAANALRVAVGLTGVALFVIGALKSLVILQSTARAGLETLLMGGLAAAVAYAVGFWLHELV